MEKLFPIVAMIPLNNYNSLTVEHREEHLFSDCQRIDEALLLENTPTQLCGLLKQLLQQPIFLFDEALRPWDYLYETDVQQVYEEKYFISNAEQILSNSYSLPKRRLKEQYYLLALGAKTPAGYLLCPGNLLQGKSCSRLLRHGLVALTTAIQRANALRRLSDRYYLSLFQNTQSAISSYALLNAEQVGFPVRGYRRLVLLRTDNTPRSTEQRLQNLLKQVAYRNDTRFVALQDDGLLLLAFSASDETIPTQLMKTAQRTYPDVRIMCCEKETEQGQHILAQAAEFLQLACPLPLSPGLLSYWHLSLYNLMQTSGHGDIFQTGHAIIRQLLTNSPKNMELLQTAAQYLDCNKNISRTAQRMYLHPNTIRYRLNQINKIIGHDVFRNKEECLYLQISLQILFQETKNNEN